MWYLREALTDALYNQKLGQETVKKIKKKAPETGWGGERGQNVIIESQRKEVVWR